MMFRNRKAAFLWGFTAVWVGMLLAFTWLYIRDGDPPGEMHGWLLPAIIAFWFAGIGLTVYALSKPCIVVAVSRSGIVVNLRFPFHSERKVFARGDVERAEVVHTKDSDNDDYFTARARTRDGESVDFQEGPNRAAIAKACDRFNQALFGQDSRTVEHSRGV